MPEFVTVGEIVNDAGKELGLWTADVADPFASTDANVAQMLALLKSLGREVFREKQWTYLQKEYTFATVANQAVYPLPSDFDRMIDQSGWNRTTRLPLGGPLSPQEWQFLKARLVGFTFTVMFRPLQGQLSLWPDTGIQPGFTIAFEYLSNGWVTKVDTTPAYAPTAAGDTVNFDAQLMTRGLKLAWLRDKGFDTTAAQDAYDKALMQAKDADTPARILSLNRGARGVAFEPLLGPANIPITGFGSGS